MSTPSTASSKTRNRTPKSAEQRQQEKEEQAREAQQFMVTHRVLKFSEHLERYIQFLCSCILSSEFQDSLEEDEEDKQYFYSSVFRVEEDMRTRAESLLSSSAWNTEFRKHLECFPIMSVSIAPNLWCDCEVCGRTNHPATRLVTFSGREYHRKELDESVSSFFTQDGAARKPKRKPLKRLRKKGESDREDSEEEEEEGDQQPKKKQKQTVNTGKQPARPARTVALMDLDEEDVVEDLALSDLDSDDE
eukprot:GILK01010657.1.p1 GENE.GILK01010657.1~~GILK01010657.1.p1  ORF type:complete len:280 (+),score=75.44 GILK01010657.1:98-841(+)